MLKDLYNFEKLIKPVFELLLEAIFLNKRVKPEESRSKESLKES